VFGRALTQAEDALGAIGGDRQGHDHRLARVLISEITILHMFYPVTPGRGLLESPSPPFYPSRTGSNAAYLLLTAGRHPSPPPPPRPPPPTPRLKRSSPARAALWSLLPQPSRLGILHALGQILIRTVRAAGAREGGHERT